MTTQPTQQLSGLVLLPLNKIRPSRNNPRRTVDGIEDLAASIAQVGLLQPIVVHHAPRPDDPRPFEILYGHRRFAAVRMLHKREVPAIVRRPLADDAALVARIAENDQRASLDPIEEARALQQLQRGGDLTHEQIGIKISRSVTYVARRLMLLELSVEEQEKVRAGHYSVNYAEGLVRTGRKAARPADGSRPVGRPKGVKTKPYFGDTHPLAETARARCVHRGTPKVAGVACGPCIEAVIRADERAQTLEGTRP